MRMIAAVVTLVALLVPGVTTAQDFPRAKPEEVGFSSERLNRLTQVLRDDVAQKLIPGAVILVARHGKVALFETIGMLDPQTKAPMASDAIFRIYSMSKPITTVAAMMLFEEGRFTLDDPIAKYLPQFKDVKVGVEHAGSSGGAPTLELVPAKKPITVQDLMRHTSGLTYGFFGDMLVKTAYVDAKINTGDFTNAEFVDRLAKLPLAFQPGTTWDYSQSTDVLGRLIEVVSGKTLYAFEKERLLDPLGMTDTSFYVADKAKHARVAEPFADQRVFGREAEFNDPREPRKYESGGGGMVGTASDYAKFAQMLLNRGSAGGKQYLGPRTLAYMTSDHLGNVIVPGPYYLPGAGYGFGLGFAVRKEDGISPVQGSAGEFNWGGAGGTYFWIDPKEDMVVVFAMQSPKQRTYYRPLLKNMVYGAVVKPNGK